MAMPNHVSNISRSLNFLGCLLAVVVYFHLLLTSSAPLTLDLLASIVLAEYNRWKNDRARAHARSVLLESSAPTLQSSDLEKGVASRKGSYANESEVKAGVIAAIVGYREDPELYTKALESYREQENCRFVVAAIDGDDEPDEEMVDIFRKVYPTNSAILTLEDPLAKIAVEFGQAGLGSTVASSSRSSFEEKKSFTINNDKTDYDSDDAPSVEDSYDTDPAVILHCKTLVRQAMAAQGIDLRNDGINRLCVRQPHMHKKGIMFTAFIVSLVISEDGGPAVSDAAFVWTSDSDSWPTTGDDLRRAVETIASQPHFGGASTTLSIHNANAGIVGRLAEAVYLSEVYLIRSFPSAVGANDCQSGPCAVFRLTALEPLLLPWYRQRVFGHFMITNEDRHLTTRLLLEGWRVSFAADVVTATETPTTLRRYLLQQVRWARAIHIETSHRPKVYIMQNPLLCFNALKRLPSAFLVPTTLLIYVLTGSTLVRSIAAIDLIRRFLLRIIYLALRSPYRPPIVAWFWILPGQFFYSFTLPAINAWAALTVFDDGWGTTMRASAEKKKTKGFWAKWRECGYFVMWCGLLGAGGARMWATKYGVWSGSEGLAGAVGAVPCLVIAGLWLWWSD